jgi:sigma-B regulation protein RsbU (phosphoserine phosphatase)
MRVEASRVRQGPAEVVVSRTLLERVLERREGLLFTDMQVEGSLAASESIRGARLRSAISVPMVFDDTIYGVVQIDSLRTVAAFSQTDMRMVTVVATQLASALAYSRLHRAQLAQRMLEHDLALARRVQHQFLLAVPPEIPGHDTAVEYRPALAVGGDFYAVLPMDRGRYGLVVGDVSGKGVSAALYAAGLLADLRGLASACADPARLLGELNRKLSSGDREGMFATVALAVLEPGTGELGLSTAGHPLPLVRGPDAAVHTIGRRGSPPLGIDEDAAFDSLRFALEAGDTLVLFTDGISEATDRDHQLFGIERLEASVAAAPGDAAGVRATVLEALGAFCGDSPQADDLTLVAVSREP